jgi:hypothetical protein
MVDYCLSTYNMVKLTRLPMEEGISPVNLILLPNVSLEIKSEINR